MNYALMPLQMWRRVALRTVFSPFCSPLRQAGLREKNVWCWRQTWNCDARKNLPCVLDPTRAHRCDTSSRISGGIPCRIFSTVIRWISVSPGSLALCTNPLRWAMSCSIKKHQVLCTLFHLWTCSGKCITACISGFKTWCGKCASTRTKASTPDLTYDCAYVYAQYIYICELMYAQYTVYVLCITSLRPFVCLGLSFGLVNPPGGSIRTERCIRHHKVNISQILHEVRHGLLRCLR